MKLIGKRPLCTLCLCMILSALMGVWMPSAVGLWMIGAAAVGCAAVLVMMRTKKLAFYTGCMAVCLLIAVPIGFCASSRYYAGTVDALEELDGECLSVEGTITARKWGLGYSSGYLLRTERINGKPIRVKLLLECQFAADCRPGERIRITGTARALEDEVYGFAERQYYLARGVVLRLEAEDVDRLELLGRAGFSLTVRAEQLNMALAARLRLFLGEEAGGFLSALLLGRRDDIGADSIKAFRRLGLSHLLALSGLHLSLLTGAVSRGLRLLGLPRRWRTLFQLAFVGGYVLLTGAPISIVRAALMLTITCLFTAFFAEADHVTALFCSAALICMLNPASLLDLGLWMSVFATLAMLICGGMSFAKLPVGLRIPAKMAAAAFAANLATLPFVALGDGELSLVSLAANLLFVPLISLLLYCAPLFLLGGGPLAAPIAALTKWVLEIIRRLALVRGITISLQASGMLWFLLPLLAVCVVLLVRPPKRKWISGAAVLCAGVFFWSGAAWAASPRETEMVYTHIGQSEVIVFRQAGDTLICDMGDGSYSPLKAAAAYAADLGAAEIDTLMLTHYHTRHIGSVRRLSDIVVLRRLLLPQPNSAREWEIAADLEEIAVSAGMSVNFYTDGNAVQLGDMHITPHTRTLLSRSQQPLLLLRFAQDGKTMTYIGASVGESALAEQAMDYASDSDYLIFGSHGPNPRQCVIWRNLQRTKQIILPSAETLRFMLPDDPYIPTLAAERIHLTWD